MDRLTSGPWSRGDILSLIGLVCTVAGFALAYWQIRRTANATVATRAAVSALSRAQLLFLIPQFQVLETELDLAISMKQEGRQLALRVMTSYVHLAHEVAGLIAVHALGDPGLADELRASAKLATEAKNQIYTSRAAIAAITSELRTSMSSIGGSLSNAGVVSQSTVVDPEFQGAS